MKIGQIFGVDRTYNTQGAGKARKSEGVQSKKDAAEITSEGQIISKAMQAVSAVPNVRQDEVERLKTPVDDGSYNVAGKDIIEKLASKTEKRA